MSPIRFVHGDIGSGKTERVADWVREQARAGVRVGGVLAQKTPEGRWFVDLRAGDSMPLEHPATDEAGVEVGRFHFCQAALTGRTTGSAWRWRREALSSSSMRSARLRCAAAARLLA